MGWKRLDVRVQEYETKIVAFPFVNERPTYLGTATTKVSRYSESRTTCSFLIKGTMFLDAKFPLSTIARKTITRVTSVSHHIVYLLQRSGYMLI